MCIWCFVLLNFGSGSKLLGIIFGGKFSWLFILCMCEIINLLEINGLIYVWYIDFCMDCIGVYLKLILWSFFIRYCLIVLFFLGNIVFKYWRLIWFINDGLVNLRILFRLSINDEMKGIWLL